MSGETEADISGWTIDTLHAHLMRLLARQDDSIRRELVLMREADQKAIQVAYTAHQEALNKAFASTDRALTSALESAQRALDQRATTLDKEFHEHLDQVRHETSIAFESSDRAISKAEAANERRFESVNEFRAQLNDQAASFLTRTEYDAQHSALINKVDDEAKRNAERFGEVNRRLDVSAGKSSGIGASWAALLGGMTLIGTVIAIVVFFANK